MTLFTPSMNVLICNDCGHVSECGELYELQLSDTFAEQFSFDGTCTKCSSDNTKEVPIDESDEIP